jgi:hypothetical protein
VDKKIRILRNVEKDMMLIVGEINQHHLKANNFILSAGLKKEASILLFLYNFLFLRKY